MMRRHMVPVPSGLIIAESGGAESWRQYVPLIVSVGVIVDILLGSPLAKAAMTPLRKLQEQQDSSVDLSSSAAEGGGMFVKSKERVDSEKIALQAIEKAKSTMELRKFLEESKSDWDRMEEIKRNVDSQMSTLDEDLQRRQEELEKRQKDQA